MLRFKQINCSKSTGILDFLEVDEQSNSDEISLSLSTVKEQVISNLSVDFDLLKLPDFFRSHSYDWLPIPSYSFVLSENSAKVLKYNNGVKLLADSNLGAWEVFPKKKLLRWHLFHPDLSPSFTYNEEDKRVWHQEFMLKSGSEFLLTIFNTDEPIEEWARTPIGFFPTICFTDHCDFDTPLLLQAQRKIFKEAGLKVTKGVFLYDYSHSPFIASLQHTGILEEIKSWEREGHEIAYHALSKSEGPESQSQFEKFQSPQELKTIETYIDHGFLSYNGTRQNQNELSTWFAHQSRKGIRYIWNYVDSFEATANCNNQLASRDSSIGALRESKQLHHQHSLKEDDSRLFKAWLSFGTNENLDFSIKRLNSSFYKVRKGDLKAIPDFLKNGFVSFLNALNPNIWRRNLFQKFSPNHFSKFSPIFYSNPVQQNTEVLSFQSASVKNFETTLSDYSLTKIQKEKGVLIAHTYFAYTGQNHYGRMFLDDSGKVNQKAVDSLNALGDLVKKELIWNPTLKEMGEFYRELKQIKYIRTDKGIEVFHAPGATRLLN